ncbi:hypothetical protein SFRURICE_000271, partial [Spodoptera frugiperda]
MPLVVRRVSVVGRLREVTAFAHAAHDEESLCDSKLVELFSMKVCDFLVNLVVSHDSYCKTNV